jgi:hypothetical protein
MCLRQSRAAACPISYATCAMKYKHLAEGLGVHRRARSSCVLGELLKVCFAPPPAPPGNGDSGKEAHRVRVQTRVRFQRRGPKSPIGFGPKSPSPRKSPTGFGPKSPSPPRSPTGFGPKSPSPRESPTGFGPRSPSPQKSPTGSDPRVRVHLGDRPGLDPGARVHGRESPIWQAICLD